MNASELFDLGVAYLGMALLVGFIMLAVAYMVLIVAARYMAYERARQFAVLLVSAIAVPILLPFGTWRYGLAFLAGVVVLGWQVSLRERDGD